MNGLLGGTDTLEGTVKRITFQNSENGYTVAQLHVEDRRQAVPIIGKIPNLAVGENIKVTGVWERHDKFGHQLRVESYSRTLPMTSEGILKFLGSGIIKGIGKATAKKLVEKFELQTLTVIERHPERLQEIEGIGKAKAERWSANFREFLGVNSVVLALMVQGISESLAFKLYKEYGVDTVSILEENPFRIAEDIPGIGFLTADKIATALGVPPLSPYRIRCGVKHVLKTAADNDGHVFLPKNELLARAVHLLGSDSEPFLEANIEDMTKLGVGGLIIQKVSEEEQYVYLGGYCHAERKVAELIRMMVVTKTKLSEDVSSLVDDVEREGSRTLAPLQRQAVEAVLEEQVVVVTGGPGTGKTTTVKAMMVAFEKVGITPVLAAPTGRAAKRMTESTGAPAKTLHRLLEYRFVDGEVEYGRNKDNPLDGSVFIVDEASMIDTLLFFRFMQALPSGARLILCGDVDQLPSVGAGRVLNDIIASAEVTVIRLQTIFRQDVESMIVKNAHRINQGNFPEVSKNGDFFFIEETNTRQLVETVLGLVSKRLPEYLQADPVEDIQVLVPMRKGDLGVDSLNKHLQKTLNPPAVEKSELFHGEQIFRVGDKVMQIKNNYQKEVFNGDVGRIVAIDEVDREVTVLYQDQEGPRQISYAPSELVELQLAYAISVHKSQGSEYSCVILPVVSQHRMMLQRNLVYTGVTRAKRFVVMIGSQKALRDAIRRNDGQHRYTLLSERIKGFI